MLWLMELKILIIIGLKVPRQAIYSKTGAIIEASCCCAQCPKPPAVICSAPGTCCTARWLLHFPPREMKMLWEDFKTLKADVLSLNMSIPILTAKINKMETNLTNFNVQLVILSDYYLDQTIRNRTLRLWIMWDRVLQIWSFQGACGLRSYDFRWCG